MQPDDPNFITGLPVEEIRASLRSTMQLAFPVDVSLQPTFRWTTTRTFDTPSHGGLPLDWQGATPVSVTSHADVIVPVAVVGPGGDPISGTAMGEFNGGKAQITILDVDYFGIVDTADQIIIGGSRFNIDFHTYNALDTITVVTLHVSSVDLA